MDATLAYPGGIPLPPIHPGRTLGAERAARGAEIA